jgi:glycosyltransferase involved in cell wall biosynthesis
VLTFSLVPTDLSPTISVVIAVRNGAGTLDRCLEALSRSDLTPWECLVVDDASDDGSMAVAERHGARVIAVDKRRGPAHARNVGARQARGAVVLFLDADVCIHRDAITRLEDHFRRDPSLDAVIGAYDDSPAATPFVSQYRNLLHCSTHRLGLPDASTFWSACGAIRREAFLRCGGFDDHFDRPAIEDIEFGSRLKAQGGRILLDSAIQVQHLKCWTLGSMIKTDIFDRGIPWTRLILRSGSMPNDLNVRWSQRLSVALASLLAAAVLLGAGYTALACVLALVRLNWPFYTLVSKRLGSWSILRAIPLHFLFHFYCAVAFLMGALLHLLDGAEPAASEVRDEQIS